MAGDDATIRNNAHTLIEQGLNGGGVLQDYFRDMISGRVKRAMEQAEYLNRTKNIPMPSERQIIDSVMEPLQEVDEKGRFKDEGLAKIEDMLVKSAKGESIVKEKNDFQSIMQKAGSAQNFIGAVSSGNPLNILMSIPMLGNSFSFIGDLANTAIRYFSDNPQKKGFGELLAETKYNRGLDKLAGAFNANGKDYVNAEALKNELLSPSEFRPVLAYAPITPDVEAKVNSNYQPDPAKGEADGIKVPTVPRDLGAPTNTLA